MSIDTINPYTMKKLNEYGENSGEEAIRKIEEVRKAQFDWKRDIDERIDFFKNHVRPQLAREKDDFASLMSMEMGKPISQSIAEVEKCIKLVDYGIDNFKNFLEEEIVPTEATRSYVRFDPLGVVLIVMPWNFPLWQVMRAAVPAMIAGNGIVLKHASIVTGTSLKLEKLFDSPLFSSVVLRGSNALPLISHVDGVSFTGSTEAGTRIAAEAAKALKKSVLELGGSDPFVVLQSADVKNAASNALFGRLQNNGQSCIASKRFIVHDSVFNEFLAELKGKFSSVVIGDPLDSKTLLGPLSSMEQTRIVSGQIDHLKGIGTVEELGEYNNGIIPPTIAVTDKEYNEEVFGPVAVLRRFHTEEEGLRLANETPFGLGASVWGDPDEAERLAPFIDAGMVFVNKIVTSDPRLPFGGVKGSGIGRELSRYGLLEFTNIKSVWVE